MAELEVLEDAALDRLHRIGGQEFLLEMIELFLRHAPERIRAARAALASGDPQGVYRSAHSLKSTAGNLGARALQSIAERVEDRAAAGDEESIAPLVEEMGRRYEVLRERLEAEQRRRTGMWERDGNRG